jgi:hypothetical protein
MAGHHITTTLTGAAQQVIATRTPCREVHLESETGNANVQVGGPTVSASDYGCTLVAGPSGALIFRPPAGQASLNLDAIYVIGTNTQKIHAFYYI